MSGPSSGEAVASATDAPGRGWRRMAWRVTKIVGGSAMFALLKLALIQLIDHFTAIPVWLNSAIVIVSITVLGLLYHTKVSFGVALSRQVAWRYLVQAVALKAAEYGMLNGLFYGLGMKLLWAQILTTGVIFLSRVFVYFKYVFVTPKPSGAGGGAAPMPLQ